MFSLGALYFDNTSPFEKKDDKVLPGKEHTYYWEVTPEVAPKEADPPCLTYTYLSHCDFVKDFNSGLIGTLMVCKNGTVILPLQTYQTYYTLCTSCKGYYKHLYHHLYLVINNSGLVNVPQNVFFLLLLGYLDKNNLMTK